jgi:protein gp37
MTDEDVNNERRAMSKTAIEWTEHTWNPVTGCDTVSPGCDNCYAERMAVRLRAMGSARYVNGFQVTLHEDKVTEPLRWSKPRMVFVNSMSDLFHPEVPDRFVNDVFDVMTNASQHTFQVLTKRPQRAAKLLAGRAVAENIWLGTSIETDQYTFRASHLRMIDLSIRFLSCEPLLGPLPSLNLDGISWVIVGGESGPGHRPMDGEWVQEIRDMSIGEGVAFFFKQWGGSTSKSGGRLLDGREWSEWPRPSDASERTA